MYLVLAHHLPAWEPSTLHHKQRDPAPWPLLQGPNSLSSLAWVFDQWQCKNVSRLILRINSCLADSCTCQSGLWKHHLLHSQFEIPSLPNSSQDSYRYWSLGSSSFPSFPLVAVAVVPLAVLRASHLGLLSDSTFEKANYGSSVATAEVERDRYSTHQEWKERSPDPHCRTTIFYS